MKKVVIFILAFLIGATVFAQTYTPRIPVFIPTRYNSMGGYHVTDTTDYFTIFANPAAITHLGGKATWFTMDTTISNPEFVGSVVGIAYDALMNPSILESTTETIANNVLGLIGENGVYVGSEHIGPLAMGSIHDFHFGTFGWGLFSKTRFFSIIPTVTHMDALAGFDNMLQLTYSAPIIDNDLHHLSVALSAKGIFMFETGLSGVEPMTLLTDLESVYDILPLYSHYGVSVDVGAYYKLFDIFSAGVVWRDAYNKLWTQSYSLVKLLEDTSSLEFSPHSTGSNDSRIDVGVGIDVPLGFAEAVITNFVVMADYKDIMHIFDGHEASRNPVLNFSAGTEITLFDVLSLRAGIQDMYLNAGFGLRFGNTNIDFALFGRELGLEPGSLPQLNASLALRVDTDKN